MRNIGISIMFMTYIVVSNTQTVKVSSHVTFAFSSTFKFDIPMVMQTETQRIRVATLCFGMTIN